MRRLIRYLRRPDIARDPFRLLARRALLEAERALLPRAFARERLVEIDGNLVMALRPGDQIERAIYLFGLYEYASARAFSRLVRPGMTVVDAGAHSGQYTLLAARRAGAGGLVVAVEPNPVVRARLERNVRMNALTNVRIEACALGDAPGRGVLAIPAGENTGVAAVRPAQAGEREIEVTTEALDAVLSRHGRERLDVLKLDVEGAESKVIAGGRASIERGRPAILFEANELYFGDERTDPTVGALRDLGYELYEPARLRRLKPGEDPRPHREYWASLNLIALHPSRAEEFLAPHG